MKKMRQWLNKAVVLYAVSLLMLSMTPFVLADDENIIGYYPLVQHVTVDDVFYSDVRVNVSSEIDAAAIDNLTFQPAGKINYTTYVKGNLFSGTTMWLDPSSGTISNSSGYVESWLWTYTGKTNNTNNTFINITWLAYEVGIAYINQTEGGTALGGHDPGTLFDNATVYIHPKAPGSGTATAYNTTQINLTWNEAVATGSDNILIYANTSSIPTVRDPVDLIYNSTDKMSEHNNDNHTTTYFLDSGFVAQTFTVGHNGPDLGFVPSSVRVKLQSASGTMYAVITTTDGTGKPQLGNELMNTSASTSGTGWFTFTFTTTTPLEYNTKYALILKNGGGGSKWYASNGQNYTGGDAYHYSGDAWFGPDGPNMDYMFEMYGSEYLHTGLSPGASWNYTFWGWNSTYNLYSLLYDSDQEETGEPNDAPVLSNPVPTNTTSPKLSYRTSQTINITISDAEGDTISGYINCSGDSQSINGGNNTYSNALTGLSPGIYVWWVNITDGENQVSKWFTFRINNKPSGGGGGGDWEPSPANAAPNVSVNTALSVNVNDTDGDFVTVAFYWENDTHIGNDTVPSGDGIASVNPAGFLAYDTEYSWYVIANDSLDFTRGPSSGYWTFNTSDLGIDLTKEWVAVPENDTIHAWINVTNTGSTNLTDVWVWDTHHNDIWYASSNYFAWMNGHLGFNITTLNVSETKNVSIWFNLTGPLSNNTCFWNRGNISHLGMVDSQNVSGLCYGYVVTKEVNSSAWQENNTYTYWINVTNTGDFSLLNLWVNDTYDSNCTYVSNSSSPMYNGSDGNHSWMFDSVSPGSSLTITIIVNATGVNVSQVNNTVNTNTSMGTTRSAFVSTFIGVHNGTIEISYSSNIVDENVNILYTGFIVMGVFAIALIGAMVVNMITKKQQEKEVNERW